jgi:thiol-disulfide isomerase/thioredoxin
MKIRLLLATLFILNAGIISAQGVPESADKILNDAFALAAKDGKKVMIVFHASWCGWCKKFDASVTDPACKEYFEKSFVIRHLVVKESKDKKNLENPGADEFLNKNGGEGTGIPFFLIFDSNGKLLADSKIRPAGDGLDKPGSNMGCPSSDEEVSAFVQLLEKFTKITDAEKQAITERFKKNRS